jgi:tetratricopeptide (TPR) repeat protein
VDVSHSLELLPAEGVEKKAADNPFPFAYVIQSGSKGKGRRAMLRGFRMESLAVALVLLLSLAVRAAEAQVPDKFTNLQYFPKTISHQDLVDHMRGFSFALGVRCQFCHVEVEKDGKKRTDFASDEKDAKKTARAMLRMVDAINQEYIAKMSLTAPIRVECVTCHRQLSIPKTMNALLAETIDKQGIQAATELYRHLRKDGLGDGQYDFGETSLNILTESLLKQDKAREAVAIMELNVEVNTPPSGWAYNLLAMSHVANKETEKAKADYRKILELNPQDEWAKKQLEQLNGSKP